MSKVRSVNKDWEFVSKGTEISLGKFVRNTSPHSHWTYRRVWSRLRTLGGIWEATKEEAMEKVQGEGD